MKKYSIYLVYLLFGLFILGSCAEESLVNKRDIEEGIPVSLKIPYTAPEMNIVTTKADGDNKAKLLMDLYVFTFDSESGKFVSGENALEDGSDFESGKIAIHTTSGSRRIYAVANTLSGMYPGIQSLLIKAIDEKWNETRFLAIVAKLSSDNIENNDDIMLMSGQWSDDSGKQVCDILPETTELPGTIKIKRVAAKVTFNIADGDKSKGKFTPKEYQVLRVPYGMNLFEGNTLSEGVDYFDVEDFQPIKENGSFTFYMSENLKKAQNTCKDYNARELYKEDGSGKRTFINADPNATYVIIKGSYTGTANDPDKAASDPSKVVAPRVMYIVHLGKGAGRGNDANDFNTDRNTDYTYNLKVNGVDNIVVEVITTKPEEDNKPREEGDVIFGGDDDVVLRCDAHFEQRLLTFKWNDLKDYSFAVKTPYTNKVFTATNGEYVTSPEDDLYWVTFYRNPNNEPTCLSYTSAKQSSPNDENLWTVEKLVKELRAWKEEKEHADWGKDSVNFTCYVNEFYYNDKYKSKEWYKYVNTGEDRKLQIFCETTLQQDNWGSSTVTKNAQYVITQRSIETIYTKSQTTAENIVAWGIETVNETGLLKSSKFSDNNEHGRKNVDLLTQSAEWIKYVDFNKNPDRNGMVNYMTKGNGAYYACLQRNRDENGNGIIDPEEIKWYLPASNQYISLWLGNEAISSEANIYGAKGGNGKVPPERHFYTSTDGERKIYWAEEGFSLSGPKLDKEHVNSSDERQYRCVRDLGVTDDQLKSGDYHLSPIFTKTGNKITLENLNSVSLRTQRAVAELRVHHEREEINKPYLKGVTVAGERCKELKNGNWTEAGHSWIAVTKDAESATNSYCKKSDGPGWRLPNQRELGLMYIAGTGGSGLCRTYYSGRPTGTSGAMGETHTFRVLDGGVVSLQEKEKMTYFRCVKDN